MRRYRWFRGLFRRRFTPGVYVRCEPVGGEPLIVGTNGTFAIMGPQEGPVRMHVLTSMEVAREGEPVTLHMIEVA